MINQLTSKCPSCGTLATQPEILENCMRTKSSASSSFDTLLETCVIPNTLKEFHYNNIGEDPCMHCKYNQVIEIIGSFVEMQQGAIINSWLEVHVCPDCRTQYYVNPQTNGTEKLCN